MDVFGDAPNVRQGYRDKSEEIAFRSLNEIFVNSVENP
jgi:hypothetical protein